MTLHSGSIQGRYGIGVGTVDGMVVDTRFGLISVIWASSTIPIDESSANWTVKHVDVQDGVLMINALRYELDDGSWT